MLPKFQFTVTKRFGEYPFAHRQWTHNGHCQLIHGHNWSFEITFGVADQEGLDENGFVIDFGQFKPLKEFFTEKFDHTCVIDPQDPRLPAFRQMGNNGLIKLVIMRPSSEGIARFVYNAAQEFLRRLGHDKRGVEVVQVTVYEDEKNTASYHEHTT